MGATTSKTFSSTEIVSNAISNVLISMSNNCSSNTSTSQSIRFKNIKMKGSCPLVTGGINQTSDIGINFKCIQSNSNNYDLQNKFSAELTEQLKNKLDGLALGSYSQSESESITRIRNELTNNINMNSVAACVGKLSASQEFLLDGLEMDCTTDEKKTALIQGGIRQLIIAKVVTDCTQGNSNVVNLVNELDSIVKKKIDNETTGLSTGAIFTGLIVIGIVALVILAIVLGFNPISWIIGLFR